MISRVKYHRDGMVSVDGDVVAVWERDEKTGFNVYPYEHRWVKGKGVNASPRYLADGYVAKLAAHRAKAQE